MRAWLKRVLFAVPAMTIVSFSARARAGAADSNDVSFGVEADLVSRYVFRGLALSRGPVAQPSAWASVGGWTALAWGNVLVRDEARERLSAALVSLEDEVRVGRVTIEPGIVVYEASRGRRAQVTAEASVQAAFDVGSGFRLVSSHALDTAARPGAYFATAGGEWRRESGRASLRAVADLGWGSERFNAAQFGRAAAAFDLAEASLRARYALTPVFFAAVLVDGAAVLLPGHRPRSAASPLVTFGTAFGAEL